MSDHLAIGIDATFLGRDQRGMGRYLRCILNEWKQEDHLRFFLLTKHKRYLKDLNDWAAEGWSCLPHQQSPPLDVCWYPWNRIDWMGDYRRVVTIHDVAPFTNYHSSQNPSADQTRLRTAVERADLIITPSEFSQVELISTLDVGRDKTRVVHSGVETFFRPPDQPRSLHSLVGDEPYFLFVGNHEVRKNLHGLLEAFSQLIEEVDHSLVLVSPRPTEPSWAERLLGQHSSLHTLAAKLDSRLVWLTGVDDEMLVELYSQCAAFVMPSYYEGFGLPLLEAMACGATTVVAKCASLPEIGGSAPHWFNPDEPGDFVGALRKSLVERRTQQSLEQAARFDWGKTADDTLEVLRRSPSFNA